jgi:hypothetical protein
MPGTYEAIAYEFNPQLGANVGRVAITLKLSADKFEVAQLIQRMQPDPNEWEMRGRGDYRVSDKVIGYFNLCGEVPHVGYWYAASGDDLILWEGNSPTIRLRRRP